MTQHVANRSKLQFHTNPMTTLMHRKTQNQHSKQTVSTYSVTVHCQPTISLQHQVPPCLQCHDVPNSLSLSTPVPSCQANRHASGLNPQVTSQCKHPSRSTVPARYRTSGVQHLLHVATKPRSLTKQTRPSRFSCQRFSNQWQLNLIALGSFRVLMPIFLNSTATKPGHLGTIPGSHAALSLFNCQF